MSQGMQAVLEVGKGKEIGFLLKSAKAVQPHQHLGFLVRLT